MNTETPTTQDKTNTLFGGRVASALHEDGSTEEIRVRQLRMRDYEKAFTIFEDEIAFTAFCCIGTAGADPNASPPFDKEWALTLDPESYNLIQQTAQEVNKSFFVYADRRSERVREAIAKMSPETIKLAAELGKPGGSISSTSSPRPRPRPF